MAAAACEAALPLIQAALSSAGDEILIKMTFI